jgi:hypothetical protein
MGRPSPMWRPERRALAAELVADCEAFLLGRYAERLSELGAPVPVWAWTNLLAHGSEDDLRAAAASLGAAGSGAWHSARARIAEELLAATGPGISIAGLQAAVLAPLEVSLAAREEVDRWDRRTWLATVRAALRSYRSYRPSRTT